VLTPPLLELRGVTKNFGGLRPLRVVELVVAAGETVVVEGGNEAAASVLTDLATGTTLPDEGRVVVSGTATSDLADQDAWLAFLERFGIVNARVVLLDELTVLQNVAVPLTLDLDPIEDGVRAHALRLAAVAGLPPEALSARLADAGPLTRFQVRLARALAHDPQLLLVEHPTLGLPPADVRACAEALRACTEALSLRSAQDFSPALRRDDRLAQDFSPDQRRADRLEQDLAPALHDAAACLVVSNDGRLAAAVATRRLTWDGATGRMAERRGWLDALRRRS